jgi:SAM-dependent methyltransferase
VDIRDSANPLLVRARRWLDRVNARHPWNHNEYFHGWILRSLPARRRAAIDVGCGRGVLAGKLASHFAHVTGIDADAGMAAAAGARLAQDPRVTIRRCRFEDFAAAGGDGQADLITMVASLHHLDLDDTLARIPGLLAPGGRLLVVGLARVNSLPDLAVELASAAANPVMGLIKHPRAARPRDRPAAGQPVVPVKDPATTLAEITAAARARLPNAAIRRHLFFRYTLRWDKPLVTAPAPGSVSPAARTGRSVPGES